jgi:predicted small lipoprotein YifL
MKNIFCILVFIIIAISVYDCGYKGPLYMPKNTEASQVVTNNNESSSSISTKSNESKVFESNIKTNKLKLNESSVKQSNNINSRSNLNESN